MFRRLRKEGWMENLGFSFEQGVNLAFLFLQNVFVSLSTIVPTCSYCLTT